MTVAGSPAEAKTINAEGLRRRGFESAEISELRRAFKILYRQGLTLMLPWNDWKAWSPRRRVSRY